MKTEKKRNTKSLARRIATDLFTNGQGQRAKRLQLMLSGEQNGGGWCYRAAVDVIETHLLKQP